jgi:transketolase
MTNKEFANQIRKISLEMVYKAKASHIGSAFSIADIVAVLYNDFLKISISNINDDQRDRFILSKGHACVAIYAALYLKGIVSSDQIKSYAQNDSDMMSHISHKIDGVEFSTGSLGHGLSFGLGKALALKMKKSLSQVIVIVGDGEMQEGSIWEAMMFASFHKLNNLTLIIDNNNLQSLTSVDATLSLSPLDKKVEAFGWQCYEIDGHNLSDISNTLKIKTETPKCIIAKTTKGKGIDYMENKVEWHYKSPSENEFINGINQLNEK